MAHLAHRLQQHSSANLVRADRDMVADVYDAKRKCTDPRKARMRAITARIVGRATRACSANANVAWLDDAALSLSNVLFPVVAAKPSFRVFLPNCTDAVVAFHRRADIMRRCTPLYMTMGPVPPAFIDHFESRFGVSFLDCVIAHQDDKENGGITWAVIVHDGMFAPVSTIAEINAMLRLHYEVGSAIIFSVSPRSESSFGIDDVVTHMHNAARLNGYELEPYPMLPSEREHLQYEYDDRGRAIAVWIDTGVRTYFWRVRRVFRVPSRGSIRMAAPVGTVVGRTPRELEALRCREATQGALGAPWHRVVTAEESAASRKRPRVTEPDPAQFAYLDDGKPARWDTNCRHYVALNLYDRKPNGGLRGYCRECTPKRLRQKQGRIERALGRETTKSKK